MNLNRFFCFLVFFFIAVNCFGQEQDNIVEVKKFDVPIESVCWSPDGTFYITTKGNGLLFWDSATDELIESKSEYNASILSLDINDEGTCVVVVYNDNTFAVDGLRGNNYHTHQKGISDTPILDAVFSDNYTLLLPLDGKNIYSFFCLLTTNKSIIKQDMVSDNSYVYSLDISNDSSKLLITSSDGKSHLIDTATKQEMKHIDGYNQVSICSKFNKTGDYFLYASDEYTIKIQAVNSDEEFTIKNYDKPVNGADFSPNGKSVAIADKRGFVKIYDIKHGFVEDALKLDDGDYAFSCEFSPDGEYLLVGTKLGHVIKWKPKYQVTGGFYTGESGSGNGSGNGEGSGSGNGDSTGTGESQGSDNEDKNVYVIGSQDNIEGQANIFNTSNTKKIVDLARHNIYAGVGVGTIKSKMFLGNAKLKVGYHNFQFYPFYWGGGLGIDVGLTKKDMPYKYKVKGKSVPAPVLLGIAPTAKGGFHYLFDKIDLLAFAELGMGANIRMLTTGGFVGKPTVSFFTSIGVGAQWKFLRAEFDVAIDTNFIYSLNGTIGCSFKLVPRKKSKGAKK